MYSLRTRSVWHLVDSVTTAIAQSYGIARTRALNNPLELVRIRAQRDHLYTESALLERELEPFPVKQIGQAAPRTPPLQP